MEKKKVSALCIAITLVAIFVSLPVLARTAVYPLTIVDGNSMYPKLQNGDLVYFSSIDKQNIPNGTTIVFVQGETGLSLLDGLVRPIVIHRIVGEVIQNDGGVCYETKGDNNDVKDPFLTRSDHVIGAATQTIPKVGLLLLFLKSPQGLIATVGLISLGYLSLHEIKRSEEKKKEKLLGALAKMVLNGSLLNERFKKLELILKYSDNIENSDFEDKNALEFLDWIKNGGLDQTWTIKTIGCSKCNGKAVILEGTQGNSVMICSLCFETKAMMKEKDTLHDELFEENCLATKDTPSESC